MELDEMDRQLCELFIKRFCSRMRLLRLRRKLTQKCIMLKYLQYQSATEKLYQTYLLKLFELFPQENNKQFLDPLNFTHFKEKRKKGPPKKRSQYWWEKVFPQLTKREFYNIFHVYHKFYMELCDKLRSQLEPLPFSSNSNIKLPTDGIGVGKQIAISLYKLSQGAEFSKAGRIFGVHKSTVHRFFYRFLTCLNTTFKTDYQLQNLTYDQCLKMNQNLLNNSINSIKNAIGVLVRINFTVGYSRKQIETLAIIDGERKFHFVHLNEANDDESFYQKLDMLCKKNHPNNALDPNEKYLIITDQIVPNMDCFLNKNDIIQQLKSERADGNNFQLIIDDINKLLKIEEYGVRVLVERWNTLGCNMNYEADAISLIIKSCFLLHNLCEDYLQENNLEYEEIEVIGEIKNEEPIQEEAEAEIEIKQEKDYDDDDSESDEGSIEQNNDDARNFTINCDDASEEEDDNEIENKEIGNVSVIDEYYGDDYDENIECNDNKSTKNNTKDVKMYDEDDENGDEEMYSDYLTEVE